MQLRICHSNFGAILHRFQDIAAFMCSWPHPYSTLILRMFPTRCTKSSILGPMWAGSSSYSAVKLFSKYSNLCDHDTWALRTDRQTDRQTTYCRMTALCVASRGKNGVDLCTCRATTAIDEQKYWHNYSKNGHVQLSVMLTRTWVSRTRTRTRTLPQGPGQGQRLE